MTPPAKGTHVLIHYTCSLEGGEVVGTSRDEEPLKFELGGDEVLPGVNEAVLTMEAGETRKVTLPPDKAYGDPKEELVVEVPKSDLPDGLEPKVGMRLGGRSQGWDWSVLVRETSGESVVLDGNHPLAGKTLTFEIELLEILTD